MAQVEIANFVEKGHAQLAAPFLRRHRIQASVPIPFPNLHTGTGRTGMIPETPLYVDEKDAAKAADLLNRVLAGGFSDGDPSEGSREGLGAALAEALLPAPGFKNPSRVEKLAPLIIAAGVVVLPWPGLSSHHGVALLSQ